MEILGKTENTAMSKKTSPHSKIENIERPITQSEKQQLNPSSHSEECKHCALSWANKQQLPYTKLS